MDWEGTSYDGVSEREFALWLEEERALLEWEEPSCDATCRLPAPTREDRDWDAIERGDVEFYSHFEALQ